MADQLQSFLVLVGDDRQLRVGGDQIRGIDQLAVDLAGQRCARQARADAGGDLGHGDGLRETAL